MSYIQITEKNHHDVYPAIDPRGALKGSLQGKSVLITGGGRGIGKATTLAFALAGATTIVITARSQHELDAARDDILKEAHLSPAPKVLTHVTDVTSIESVDGLFAMLDKERVLPDVLVNNAGYLERVRKIHESDPAEWWSTWEVNIKGTYLPTHALLKRRHAQGVTSESTIICTSSIGAIRTRPGMSAYQPTKSAVNRFAEFINAEYADSGVRGFAYHPGGVMTKLARDNMPPETHSQLGDTPELAAGFCVWLASQKAADAFRGRYVSCNWDVDEMAALAEKHGAEKEWLLMRPVHAA